ncbi:MAG: hypothetical protein AAF694_25950 [Bacteroidota bacterium]
MAKKFIARIEQPLSEEVLADLFTSRKSAPKSTDGQGGKSTQSIPGSRKKRFLKSLNTSRENSTNSPNEYAPSSERRFLDAMEDVLNDQAFENIFPSKKKAAPQDKILDESEVPFSLMISENIFNRAKQIAQSRGVRVKDVINMALERYIDQVKM